MKTQITAYRPGIDDEEVLQLRAEVYGAGHPHTSKSFFEWMFGGNGQAPGSGVVMRRDGKVISFAAFVPRTLRFGDTTTRVAFGLDFMASPSLQGLSGLYAYKTMVAWAEQARELSHDLAVCFPNAQSIRLLTSDKLDWLVIASPRLLVFPTLSIHFGEPPAARIPAALATVGGRALALALYPFQAKPSAGDSVTPLDFRSDAQQLDVLWERAGRSKHHFLRTATFLARRYGMHPAYSYRVLGCWRNGVLAGYIVTVRRKVMGAESELVVDGLWGDDDASAARALLAAVLTRARREGTGLIGSIALPGTALYAALKRAGFLPVPTRIDPKPFYLAVIPLTAKGQACLNGRDWHLSWGDMDVV